MEVEHVLALVLLLDVAVADQEQTGGLSALHLQASHHPVLPNGSDEAVKCQAGQA